MSGDVCKLLLHHSENCCLTGSGLLMEMCASSRLELILADSLSTKASLGWIMLIHCALLGPALLIQVSNIALCC